MLGAPAMLGTSSGNGQRDLTALQEQLNVKDQQVRALAGTLQHYRNWASTIQARYQMFSPEVIRPSKRIYVGGLPPNTMDVELRQFLNEVMVKSGGVVSAGFPITNCKVYDDKNYAFVEFRSVEEASNCMAFDGLAFKDGFLRIRRPNNYDPNAALMLGPPDPNPTMDLSELRIVKELLLPYGPLRAFNLVMDRQTGNSKGYAFCEYADATLTEYVVQSLNGKPVGSKYLTVKRALGPTGGLTSPLPSTSSASQPLAPSPAATLVRRP